MDPELNAPERRQEEKNEKEEAKILNVNICNGESGCEKGDVELFIFFYCLFCEFSLIVYFFNCVLKRAEAETSPLFICILYFW